MYDFFYGSALRTILNVFCLMVCHTSSLRSVFCVVFECLVRQFLAHCFYCVFVVTLVLCAPFWMSSVWFKICSYVSVLRTILNVFCMIVWYSSALRSVWDVLCRICGYVTVLRTVLYVFCLIILCVSSLCTFWMCSVRFVVTLVYCALFWMCSVWLFGMLVPCALFWKCSVGFFVRIVSCALFWICCVWFFHASSSYTLLHVFCLIVFHVGCLCIGLCVLHCSLVRLCLAHSHKCVLKSFSYVIVLRTVLKCVVHDCLVR